jgi:hypothetical protein
MSVGKSLGDVTKRVLATAAKARRESLRSFGITRSHRQLAAEGGKSVMPTRSHESAPSSTSSVVDVDIGALAAGARFA